ncbi:hypothetical protein C1645_837311 [Glomus cerebriforme]|uniref:Uncharacterized protein n=1 Tax=Glomus cerebriforme TaxID=658196 RepID=A0A397S8V3_9GLOM|nr:hypothetical protein C1645_837311 [Glomus cerebriforme]
MSQLDADCLNEIFEYLEDDITSLSSCLLVSRLWCKISVRTLWRSVRNHKTLIACLSNESKEILYKNGIIISNPTSKPPLFNYVAFIKNLSIYKIDNIIKNILTNYQSIITSQSLNHVKFIVAQELYKLLMNQISLKKLNFYSYATIIIPKVTFTCYPEAKNCLKDLSELSCRSDIYPEFFYQLSQICHNIQYLDITFKEIISNGLADLISVQQNLKYLVIQCYGGEDLTEIIPSLTTKFSNLRELVLSFINSDSFEYFKKLQYINFSQLQNLKLSHRHPKVEILIKFLENNGKNLKNFHICCQDNSLNLAIAKFCPNLRKIFTIFKKDELNSLKMIFDSCKYLESIEICCGDEYLNDKEVLEVISKYSPKNFYELKIYYVWAAQSEILPEELEKFFINWKDRVPQKSLSFIITKGPLANVKNENVEIIEKYKKLGIIKKFVY